MRLTKIEVHWKDARCLDRVFQDELAETNFEADYHAVGYLLQDLPRVLVICQGILPKADDNDITMFRNVLSIPKCQIIDLRLLSPEQDAKPRQVSRVVIEKIESLKLKRSEY